MLINRWLKSVLAVSVGVLCLTACMPAGTKPKSEGDIELAQLKAPEEGQEMAVVTTNKGVIKFVLYEKYAPKTVKQFKTLVADGFYSGNKVFAAQKDAASFFAGATDENGDTGKIATDDSKALEPEVSQDVWHFTGAVSAFGTEEGMIEKKVLSDSRFFMVGTKPVEKEILDNMAEYEYPEKVMNAYKELGGVPTLTGRYTVFGQVVEGIEVVDEIANTQTSTNDKGELTAVPSEDIVIEKIEMSTYSSENVKITL